MTAEIIALIVAALAGMTMAFQGAMNAGLSASTGLWGMAFFVHASGLVLATVGLFVAGQAGKLGALPRAPVANVWGGVLGVLIIYAVARSIPKVGAGPATTAIIVGQVITAFLIDHFGLFGLDDLPLTWLRPVGLGFLSIGAYLLLKK